MRVVRRFQERHLLASASLGLRRCERGDGGKEHPQRSSRRCRYPSGNHEKQIDPLSCPFLISLG